MVLKTIHAKNFKSSLYISICVWICTGRFAHMYVGQGGKNKQWLVYKTHNDLYTSCTLYLYTSHTACVRCLCIPCNVYSMAMYTIRGNWTRSWGRENILMHNYTISCREYLFSTFIHRKHMQHYSISLVKSCILYLVAKTLVERKQCFEKLNIHLTIDIIAVGTKKRYNWN